MNNQAPKETLAELYVAIEEWQEELIRSISDFMEQLKRSTVALDSRPFRQRKTKRKVRMPPGPRICRRRRSFRSAAPPWKA